MASSAAGGAALAVAALEALGRGDVPEDEKIAWVGRTGSLSAVRSLRGGVVQLSVDGGRMHLESLDTPLELEVLSCAVEARPKEVSSSEGHLRAPSSPFFEAFVAEAEEAVSLARRALAEGDLRGLGAVMERDALAMHGVMLSSRPPIVYATDATWRVWHRIAAWRQEGLEAYLTLDAGPNPHVLCRRSDGDEVAGLLGGLSDVQSVLRSPVHREGAHVVPGADREASRPARLLGPG
jgi:diphosphomevalonate decarboxylase